MAGAGLLPSCRAGTILCRLLLASDEREVLSDDIKADTRYKVELAARTAGLNSLVSL